MAENNLITEQWRPVVGYEGYYEVSDMGRVRSARKSTSSFIGKIIKPYINRWGYFTVNLCRTNRRKQGFVHVLVAEAFISPRLKKHQVNHIDGIKSNNLVSNLEHCTAKENMAHASRLGLLASGERHGSRTCPDALPHGDSHHSRLRPENMARGLRNGAHTKPERVRRGEDNGFAKLTKAQVLEIRARYIRGNGAVLGREFGVKCQTVHDIVTEKRWRHLLPLPQ